MRMPPPLGLIRAFAVDDEPGVKGTLDLKTHETFGVYTRRIYKLLGME